MLRLAFLLVLSVSVAWEAGARAQTAAPAAANETSATPAVAPPSQVRHLLELLDDPSVRAWLDSQRGATRSAAPPPATSSPTAESRVTDRLLGRFEGLGDHLARVVAGLPRLPGEVAEAAELLGTELGGRDLVEILALLTGFVALGLTLEMLLRSATRRFRRSAADWAANGLGHRIRFLGVRLGLGLASVGAFAAGSLGAFILLDLPPLMKRIVLAYLLAVLGVRIVAVSARVLLAPDAGTSSAAERVVPLADEAARFWYLRILVFAGYLAAGWATFDLMTPLGFAREAQLALAHVFGLGLLGLALEAIWRRPRATDGAERRGLAANTLLTTYLLVLAAFWLAGAPGVFSLGLVALFLPLAISTTEASVANLARPAAAAAPGSDEATPAPTAAGQSAARGVSGVLLERGIRAALIAVAVLFVADAWRVDLVALTSDQERFGARVVRAGLSIVMIFLLADLLWQVLKAVIDRKLAAATPAAPGVGTSVRDARLRTLLPIFRNILLVVIVSCAGLMALSELGVEIGPLIAGAGVVGVAVGFGAQTIVKDIISGIFYLLDDAFRVGEYIQSGSYTGTVESFSLRSVKLRAPRGPVFTVPFGQLGAVENLSRDWAIDKFQIGVTYDTDLDKARRLVKKVGEELKADPEIGPSIIEPLKMQGVQEFGSYAIQIRCKMTTRPGDQTTVRRKAYAMIKKAFDENGISFAFPTVQVAGGGDAASVKPAVANQVLELLQPPKAADG